MLINCPECNKEISDKTTNCIHCGFPIKLNLNICNINGNIYNLSEILDKINQKQSKGMVIRAICDIQNMALCDANKLYNIIIETGKIPETFNCEIIQLSQSDKPKCPTCQSTNIHKISGLESGASILTFGIFSKKINKTYKCNSCGCTW